jgi:hypothetical protein
VQHASIICCDAALLLGHASLLSSAKYLSPETCGSGGESADTVAPVMLNPASTGGCRGISWRPSGQLRGCRACGQAMSNTDSQCTIPIDLTQFSSIPNQISVVFFLSYLQKETLIPRADGEE